MTEVERWERPADAATEAVMWALIEDVAKERKDEIRVWVLDAMRDQGIKSLEATVNGTVVGSVTRSKDSEKLAIKDEAAFMEYAIQYWREFVTVAYEHKRMILDKLQHVDGVWVDLQGVVVPGVGMKPTFGRVSVNKDKSAKDTVRGLMQLDQRLRELTSGV